MSSSWCRSPLRYMGGKQRQARAIAKMLPRDCSDLREPFFGGGSITLSMRQLRPWIKCWGNDLYHPNFNFWNELRSDPCPLFDGASEVLRRVDAIEQGGVPRREAAKQVVPLLSQALFNGEYSVDVSEAQAEAIAYFVRSRVSYSGAGDCGGIGSAERFNLAVCDRLIPVSSLLQGVKLTNLDFSEVVSTPPTGDTVYVIDPPYHLPVENSLNCPWLLTIDDCPRSRDELAPYNTFSKSMFYGSSQTKTTELWATNYPLPCQKYQQLELTRKPCPIKI